MKLRSQLALVMVATVLIPLAVLLLVVRAEIADRLTEEHRGRVAALIESVSRSLEAEDVRLGQAVGAIQDRLVLDTPLRRWALGDSIWEAALPAIGPAVAAGAGVDVLVVTDTLGRLVTAAGSASGGRVPAAAATLHEIHQREDAAPAPLVQFAAFGTSARHPAGRPAIALVRTGTAIVAGRRFPLVAGRLIGPSVVGLAPADTSMAVGLIVSGQLIAGTSIAGLSRDLPVGFVSEEGSAREGVVRVTHHLGHLEGVIASMDRWLLLAFGLVAFAGLAGAWAVASRFVRPIQELTLATEAIQLEQSGTRFLTRRRDEVGALGRTIDAMLRRLRRSAAHLREAERRATTGHFARQANHDIKNGLTPIRNVVRHLDELADSPEELSRVFRERQHTLESGMSYLEDLAGAYARISNRPDPRPLDLQQVVSDAVQAMAAADDRVRMASGPRVPALADPLAVRRIVENLTTNALQSLPGGLGSVSVSVRGLASVAQINVVDTGAGIPPEVQDKLFDDFYTTRTDGAGLGLSIVRRLALDMNGSVRVESTPGQGSTFSVELPTTPDA